MNTLFEALKTEEFWKEFLAVKAEMGSLPPAQLEDFETFITKKEYEPVVQQIMETQEISLPVMHEVSKSGTQKKRIVFSFRREENYVMKSITYLLRAYDDIFADNLYSFRAKTGVKKAVHRVTKRVNLKSTYSFKIDIHDYFNSVDTEKILEQLREVLAQEPILLHLIENTLRNPYALYEGKIVEARKGIMAGVPWAGFLADLYLTDLDHYFEEKGVVYLRYSDDIIVFAETAEACAAHEKTIREFLEDRHLTVNSAKVKYTVPGEKVEFLGFAFGQDETDLADISLKKIKDKMKRKARALYRWRIRKGLDGEKAAKAYIRILNSKFYDNPVKGEITWCRWYFPVITTDRSLKMIDEYAVACIRYLYTGKYGKQNYNLRYETIKELGYRSLVNNFWRYKDEGEES